MFEEGEEKDATGRIEKGQQAPERARAPKHGAQTGVSEAERAETGRENRHTDDREEGGRGRQPLFSDTHAP